MFKFYFGNKKDRDGIFHGRSWSLNGALLILKEWSEEEATGSIQFDTTTFHVQIHGLPPKYLHQNSTEKISNQIDILHQESIIKRCVVGHRFICIRVDIDTEAPIPAGFFQDKPNGEESWIQFKYERLSELCYNCGALDHVTGAVDLGSRQRSRKRTE